MKIVIITGATKGLGLAITQKLLQDNYKVIGIGRSTGKATQQLLSDFPEQYFHEHYDFSYTDGIHNFATELVKKYGRPYGLINNAALGHDGILATMHESQISEIMRVNIEAPILLTKYLLRPMLINQVGRVINISSIIASTGFKGLAVYAASKAALEGFTKSLCREVGKGGITVNSVAPGYMETGMTAGLQDEKLESIKRRSPLGRLTRTADVAESVAFLLTAAAASVTGTTLTVDSGSTA